MGDKWSPPGSEKFEPPRPDEPDPPTKTAMIEMDADGVGEWIGGLIILAIVITLCLLVLHWAGVI